MCVLVGLPATARADRHKQARMAKANLKAGIELFNKGDHDLAIEKLKIALALGGDVSANYYLGRAYEAKGEPAQAIYYLQTFVDQGNRKGDLYQDAQQRIAALEEKPKPSDTPSELPEEPPPEPPPAPPVEPTPEVVAPPTPTPLPAPTPAPVARKDRSTGMARIRLAGLITLGAGVLVAGTGGYFAWLAHDRSDQISQIFTDGTAWDSRYDDLYDEGRDAQRNARILLGVGGAAVIAGVVLVVLGREDSSPPPVTVSAQSGGASVNLWCDF